MVGAEMPTNSDLIKWSEQGRLHIKYDEVQTESNPGTKTSAITFKINDSLTALGFQNGQIALREGQTVMISDNTPGSTLSNKGVIVAEPSYASSPPTISVALYEADQVVPKDTNLSLFVYGSEFKKELLE